MGIPNKQRWLEHAVMSEPFNGIRMTFGRMIFNEIDRSYELHGCPRWGPHEAASIIREEFEEFWDTIKADAPIEDQVEELMQLAAMCFRYAETDPEIARYLREAL